MAVAKRALEIDESKTTYMEHPSNKKSIGLALEEIKSDKVDFLLIAKDAGADGCKKLQYKIENMKVYNLFCVEELDKALDKVNTVGYEFLTKEYGIKIEKAKKKPISLGTCAIKEVTSK